MFKLPAELKAISNAFRMISWNNNKKLATDEQFEEFESKFSSLVDNMKKDFAKFKSAASQSYETDRQRAKSLNTAAEGLWEKFSDAADARTYIMKNNMMLSADQVVKTLDKLHDVVEMFDTVADKCPESADPIYGNKDKTTREMTAALRFVISAKAPGEGQKLGDLIEKQNWRNKEFKDVMLKDVRGNDHSLS